MKGVKGGSMREPYAKNVKCPKCGKEMECVDIDYNFKGNQDEYWECDDICLCTALVKVRYGKVCKVEFIEHD